MATRFYKHTSDGDSVALSANVWPPVALRLLLAIAERTHDGNATRYEPSAWFRQSPTSRNRSRWSRWTRRLAHAGLIRRLTEPNRDRVRQVAVTHAGQTWIEEHCGPGAIADFSLNWNIPNRKSEVSPHPTWSPYDANRIMAD